MASEERERRHLHERFESALGARAADHLLEGMAMLDRDQHTSREAVDLLRADMFELLHEQARRAESQFRTLLFAMLGTVLTVAAMAFGAASI